MNKNIILNINKKLNYKSAIPDESFCSKIYQILKKRFDYSERIIKTSKNFDNGLFTIQKNTIKHDYEYVYLIFILFLHY